MRPKHVWRGARSEKKTAAGTGWCDLHWVDRRHHRRRRGGAADRSPARGCCSWRPATGRGGDRGGQSQSADGDRHRLRRRRRRRRRLTVAAAVCSRVRPSARFFSALGPITRFRCEKSKAFFQLQSTKCAQRQYIIIISVKGCCSCYFMVCTMVV